MPRSYKRHFLTSSALALAVAGVLSSPAQAVDYNVTAASGCPATPFCDNAGTINPGAALNENFRLLLDDATPVVINDDTTSTTIDGALYVLDTSGSSSIEFQNSVESTTGQTLVATNGAQSGPRTITFTSDLHTTSGLVVDTSNSGAQVVTVIFESAASFDSGTSGVVVGNNDVVELRGSTSAGTDASGYNLNTISGSGSGNGSTLQFVQQANDAEINEPTLVVSNFETVETVGSFGTDATHQISTLTNIGTLNLLDSTSGNLTLNGAGASDVGTANIGNTLDIRANSLLSATTINLTDDGVLLSDSDTSIDADTVNISDTAGFGASTDIVFTGGTTVTITGNVAADTMSQNLQANGGADVLSIDGGGTGANDYTLSGNITNFETINITGNEVALTGNVTGVDDIDITGGAILDISSVGTLSVANDIDVQNGTLNVSGSTIGGDLTVDVANAILLGDIVFDASDNIVTFDGDGSLGPTITNNINAAGETSADQMVIDMDLATDSLALTGNITGFETISVNTGELDISSAASFDSDLIDVGADGALDITSQTISGDVTLDVNATLTGNLTFDGGDNTLTFDGDGSPAASFANDFDGGGETAGDALVVAMDNSADSLGLTGNITDFETVTIDEGELDLSGATSLSVGGIVVNDGGAINTGAFTLTDDVTINAGGDINGGVINFGAGAQTLDITNATAGVQSIAANITDAGGADILDLTAGNAATDLTLSGDISGFETINAAGSGTVTLSGAVTGVDDITVGGGATLDLSGVTGASITVTNDIIVDGSVLEAGATTLDSDLTMRGTSTFAGTTDLDLDGALTFDGNTGGGVTHTANIDTGGNAVTVNTTGTVELDGNLTNVSGLTVGSNATLDLDGTLNSLASSSIDGTLDITDMATADGVFTVNSSGTLLSDADTVISGTVEAEAGSTIATAVFGAGDDVFTITGTAGADNVTHTVDLGGGDNQMTVDGGGTGANGLTFNGTYSNIDTLTITANDVTANATLSGVTDLAVSAGASLTATQAIGATNAVLDGTYDITALASEDAIITVNATGVLLTDDDTVLGSDVTVNAGGNFGASTDVTFSGAAQSLDITGTGGADTFDENFDGGGGADDLSVNGGGTAASFTGTIDSFETITIDTGVTAFTNTITGTDDIDVINGGTIDLSGYAPATLSISNDIDVDNGTLITDAGLALDTDLVFDYQNGDSSGAIQMGDNGHSVTIDGVGVGVGASESTITGGAGTDVFIANFDAGGTYTQSHTITNFETLTVTSGTLDMDADVVFTTTDIDSTLDIRDATTFGSTTSITVNNGGVLLSDSNSVIDTDLLSVNDGGGFGASTDIVLDGNDSTLDFTGTAGADTITANLDGGGGTDSLIIDSNGVGSNRLTASGAISGFETIDIDGGEVRLTGSVSGLDTAIVDGILEVTDLVNFDAATAINVGTTGVLETDLDTTINTATLDIAGGGSLGATTDVLFGTGDSDFIYDATGGSNTINANIDMGAGTDGMSFQGGVTLNGDYSNVENLTVTADALTFGVGSSINALTQTTLQAGTAALTVSDLAAFSSTTITMADGTSLTSDADTVIEATTLAMSDSANLLGDIQLDTNGGAWTVDTTGAPAVIDGNIDGGDNSWTADLSGANAITLNGTISDFGAMSIVNANTDVNGVIQDFTSLVIGGQADITDAANIGQAGDGTITVIDGAILLTDADTLIGTDLTLDDGAGFGASTDVLLVDNGTLTFTGTVPGTQVIGQNITDISNVVVNIAGGEINFTGTLNGMDSLAVNGGTVDLDQTSLSVDTVTVANGATLDVVDAGDFGEGTAGTMTLDTGASFVTDADTVLNFDTVTVDEGVSFGATTDLLLGADDTIFDVSGNAGVQETYSFNIDGGAGADTLVVTDAGDVSNSSVFNGDITGIETLTLTGATLAGNVDTGAGNDTLNLTASHITGDVTSGAGTDSVGFDGTSTISGSFDGGTGGDTITLNGGDLTVTGTLSNINTIDYAAAGAALIYDNASILASTITGDAGNDSLSVNQGGFSSTIDFGTGDDTLNVNAAAEATTVEFADTISFDGAGTDTINLTQGTITLNEITGAGGANDAAMVIGDNTVVTIRDTVQISTLDQESNNGLTFYLFDDTTHGELILSGNGAGNDTTLGSDLNENQISVSTDAAHQLDDGDVITLITDAGGGDLINQFVLDTSGNTLFLNFNEDTTSVAGTYAITVGIESPTTVLAPVADEATNGIANAINVAEILVDHVGVSDELGTIRTNFLNSTTAEEAAAIADTLVSNTTSGVAESTMQASNAVRDLAGRRIDYRRTGMRRQGVSSGEFDDDRTYYSPGTRVWVQGFGGITEQDERDGFEGYQADTYGSAVGVDTTDMYDAGIIGAAFSYAETEVDSDNVNDTQTDITSYQVTLYGGFELAPNTFLNSMASYTYAQNNYTRSNIGGDPALTARADYDSQQGALRMEMGHNFVLGDSVMLTPSFNADYTYGKAEAFSETGAGNAGLRIETDEYQHLDVGVDLAVSGDIRAGRSTIIRPRFNVGYSYAAINDPVETSSSFLAGGSAFSTQGLEPEEHRLHLGLGMDVFTGAGWQFSAHADAELAEDLVEATGTVRAAKAFK